MNAFTPVTALRIHALSILIGGTVAACGPQPPLPSNGGATPDDGRADSSAVLRADAAGGAPATASTDSHHGGDDPYGRATIAAHASPGDARADAGVFIHEGDSGAETGAADGAAAGDAGAPASTTGGESAGPRPLYPPSTATVGTRRPTLRWTRGDDVSGAHVDLCADRACARLLAAFDAEGTSARVPDELPPGVVFWRVRGRGATESSATWEFVVRARGGRGDADTAWGSLLDTNGDGLADVAVGAARADEGRGAVAVFHGARTGLATTPTTRLDGQGADGQFGWAVASAGDVNGDGYGDLVVGAFATAHNEGRAQVFLGGAGGLEGRPVITLRGDDGEGGRFGWAVASAGDVNADGYGDLVVSAVGADGFAGKVYLYLGGAAGPSARPAVVWLGHEANGLLGYALAAAGDFEGDGASATLVGAPGEHMDAGRAYVFAGLAPTPREALSGEDEPGSRFGLALGAGGDTDGDGRGDAVVGALGAASGAGAVFVLRGGAGARAAGPVVRRGAAGDRFGAAVALGADTDGDGLDELAVTAPGADAGAGRAYVFSGRAADAIPSAAVVLAGRDGGEELFGWSITLAGDTDGDGFGDVLVGALTSHDGDGAVYVFGGARGAVGAGDTRVLRGATGDGALFGTSLARGERRAALRRAA